MNVSFVNYDPFEQPVLVLKTAHGDTIGVIGSAENVGIDINYNEVSTIEFDITDRINGEVMPYYDQVVGMRIVELVDIGQFILMNPDEVDTGELRRKKCKCNSLEYEFTYKKITLPENTYRLWDPSGKEITVVSMIMEQMPSWRVEFVSESLQYAYRTFSVSNDNLYNFIKGTVQRSFGCVFEFDTFNRIVRIIDVNVDAETRPVLISHENLAKEIDIKENTDNLFTRLDVNGADGVDIRSVNPAGTNKLINLDYFMTKDNFSTALINKYNQWKQSWKNNITPYRYLTIRHSVAIMQKITEQSALLDLKNELTDIENEQAVIIQAIASGLKTQADLNDVNVRVRRKKEEIAAKENEIKNIERQIEDIISEMKAVQNQCSFESHFTADEMAILTPYIRDGEVSESSFVVTDNAAYTDACGGKWVDSLVVSITGSATKMTSSTSVSEIYDIRGGNVSVGNSVTGSVVSAIADIKADGSVVMSIRVGSGLTDGNEFDGASITIVGSLHSNTNDAAQNGDTGDYEISDIEFVIRDAYEYFTLDVSEYDKRSVSQDLMEYGIDVLERLAWPKYSFNVSLANFFAIKDFVDFKNQLRLGAKIDLVAGEDKALSPICTGISMNYNNPSSLTMRFGDTYSANDSKFSLLDLLEKSVSMGKNVDVGKFNYSSFVNSGAKTNIKKFMESALDVAKNAILSSGRQAITWDGAGFRLRKWANESKTAYDDEQIWMNNNSIMLTDDNWNTAKMAIGKFKDANLGDCWGVVAPMIVGTLIAGSELIIESAKKDGETSVFRMDGDGCRLYNSQMDIHNEAAHITLNPDTGIAIGQYPVCDPDTKEVNENNANFWIDSNGNVHMRGTLHGANGEFTGRVTATELIIQSGNNKDQTIKEYIDDNVQIGGRNLLPDSKELESWRYSPDKTWRYGSESGFYGFQMTESGQTSDTWHMVATPATRLPDGWYGKQITLSAYIWSENWAAMDAGGNTPIHWAVCLNKGGIDRLNYGVKYLIKPGRVELGDGISSDVPLGNDKWVRVSMTWTMDEVGMPNGSGVFTDNTHAWVQFLLRRNGSYRVYAPKLEFGNKATDWSPAPEDSDAAIAAVSAELLVQKDQISSKVGRTEFDTLGQMVAKHESSITQTPEQIRLAVEGVQIGGRNYILGTGTPYTAVGNGTRQWLFPWHCASVEATNSLFGKTVTISFDYETAITSGSFLIHIGGTWQGVEAFDSYGKTGHVSKTIAVNAASVTDDVFIYIDGTWTGSVTFSKVKVEIGNKETDWSPAPEDAEVAISKVSSELALQPDKIRMAVEGVEIGGRNLLRDADLVINNGWLDNNALNWHCRNGTRIGFGATGVDTTKDRSANFEEIYISPGDYTISFYAWKWNVDTNPTLYFDLKSADRVFEYNVIATKPEDTAKGGSVKKYTGTLRVESYNGKVKPRFVITDTFSSGDIGITEWKLERGNKATDWSPAPEDTDAAIAEVSAELVTQAGEIKATASKIENLQIGGTNLLKDSKGLTTWSYGAGNKTWRYDDPSGFARFQMTESGQTADTWHMVRTPVTQLPSGWYGRQITLSAYIWSENFANMDAGGHYPIDWTLCLSKGATDRLNYGGGFPVKPGRVELHSDFSSDVPLGNYKWVRVSKTWTLNETDMSGGSGVFTDNTHVFVQFLLRRNGSYRVYAPKLEFGNKATDWSPSPEDTDGNLSAVSKRVTTVEDGISALDEAIKSKVSTKELNEFGQTVSNRFTEVTQTATNINNRVTDEVKGLQAQINTNAKGILLQAGKKSGGTQLLKNGGFYGGLSNWSKLEYSVNGEWRNLYVEAPTPDNQYRSQEAPNLILHAQYETGMFGAAQVVKGLRKNTQYTISGYVASHRCNRAGIEIRDTTASRWAMNPVFDVGWGGTNLSAYNRFEYTFDTGDYSDYQITLYSNNFQDNAYVWWAQVKLEEGNTATAWSDHPEEFRSGSNVTITSEEVDITTPKFEVNILSDDGETNALTINESGAVFRSVVAPNVAPRYDGFGTLYVNPNATSAQIAKGDTFRSLADALAKLSGRWVGENITINMTAGMTEYGTLVMRCVFGANIAINGNGAKIVGGLALYNGSAKVVIDKLNIDMTGNIGLRADNWTRSELWDSVITGTGGGYGVYATNSAGVTVSGCEIYDCSRSLYGFVGGEIEGENCKGNCRVGANRSTLYLVGTMPCDSPTWAAATWAGQVLADVSVDQGSKPTPIPAPTTVTYNYTRSDSYRGGWSYFDTDAPRQGFNGMDIYGTIWFDAAAIRNALSGKTIKQASLRLFMVKGVGRGRSVVVQLYGTNMGYDGRSGRPELTTSYGTIGTTEPDMNNEMTIPAAVINDIVSGRIQALVLKSDDTVEYKDKFYSENYARFEGSTSATTADNCPRLTVVYQ